MTRCGRAAEIDELMRLGHWPAAADAELTVHVQGCRTCSDRLRVTEALQQMRARSMHAARVEPAALVWWRAQLRRRSEVVEKVEGPMRAQMLVLLLVVCVGLALGFELSRGVAAWRAWMGSGLGDAVGAGVARLGMGLLLASAAAVAMFAGVALYLTIERK